MPELPLNRIVRMIAENYGFSIEELASHAHDEELAEARRIAMYVCRELTGESYGVIGDLLERDHTTVMSGTKRVSDKYQKDETFRGQIDTLIEKIRKAVE